MFPYFTLDDVEHYRTLPQIFDSGLRIAGPGAQFLGHRLVESQEPLKFANHYVWQTWGEIDVRRRNVGSALEGLFKSGAAVGTNGLDTVGIWSANIPGEFPPSPCDFRESSAPGYCRSRSHLIAHSSLEWQIVDLATSLYGKALVPLYDNFGPDSIGG